MTNKTYDPLYLSRGPILWGAKDKIKAQAKTIENLEAQLEKIKAERISLSLRLSVFEAREKRATMEIPAGYQLRPLFVMGVEEPIDWTLVPAISKAIAETYPRTVSEVFRNSDGQIIGGHSLTLPARPTI